MATVAGDSGIRRKKATTARRCNMALTAGNQDSISIHAYNPANKGSKNREKRLNIGNLPQARRSSRWRTFRWLPVHSKPERRDAAGGRSSRQQLVDENNSHHYHRYRRTRQGADHPQTAGKTCRSPEKKRNHTAVLRCKNLAEDRRRMEVERRRGGWPDLFSRERGRWPRLGFVVNCSREETGGMAGLNPVSFLKFCQLCT